MFNILPWKLYEADLGRFWVHYGLIILGAVIVVITAIVQWAKPAPYGKHESMSSNWGCAIPQRLGHILSDVTPGVVLFLLVKEKLDHKDAAFSVFFLYGKARGYANYVFLAFWLCHYTHRGVLHPLMMRYKSSKVAFGITLGGFIPNCLFHFVNADFVGNAEYDSNYYYDPRFIIGLLLYIIGFIINRWADWKLRSLRSQKGDTKNGSTGYYIPYGGLFELISCPNYFGEFVEWIGWTTATWSLAGLVWTLFAAATFFPRSRHNHQWYKANFEFYPLNRKALIPWIF